MTQAINTVNYNYTAQLDLQCQMSTNMGHTTAPKKLKYFNYFLFEAVLRKSDDIKIYIYNYI